MNISFSALLPWPALALYAAAVITLCGYAVYRRMRGAWLRTLAGLVIAAALANPVIHQDEREALSDIAVLVVDHSDSQKLGTRLQQTDKAVELLKTRITELGNTDVRIAEVTSRRGHSQRHQGI